MKESDCMAIVLTMLMAWLPEIYFAATNLIHALAWGVWAVFITIATICLIHENEKRHQSRND